MCVTDRHDTTLAVKMALNLNTTNQSYSYGLRESSSEFQIVKKYQPAYWKIWKHFVALHYCRVNTLLLGKILEMSKFEEFTDN